MEAYIEMVAGHYDGSTLELGINGRLAHLFPGQELKSHTSNHPSSDYAAFSMDLLRELARCLGLTYESATGDNVGATYSSLQAATTEIFAITKARRRNIMAPFCQPIYEAWLEEEIEAGSLPFPGSIAGFLANRTAACRAEWRGDPRPQADDLKKAKAHEVWKRLGVMSDAMICTDLGADVDDVYQQLAQEQALQEAAADPEVRAILLDIDSPGGKATGMFATGYVHKEGWICSALLSSRNLLAADLERTRVFSQLFQ
jgi:capsid protein